MAAGFTRVRETPEETNAYRASHGGRRPGVYRVRCDRCHRRM